MALSFLQTAFSTTDGTSFTFSSQNLGTAAADRYIIVAVQSRSVGTDVHTIDSVTVGGVSATIVVQRQNNAANSSYAGLAIAAVPTGTTGDVVVTFSTTMLRCEVGLWRATGLASATATDFGSSTASAPTYAIDVVAGGFAIGAVTQSNGVSAAWTNLTEKYDDLQDLNTILTGASDEFATQQTNLSLTCTISGTNSEPVGVFASWELTAVAGSTPPGKRALLGVGQ